MFTGLIEAVGKVTGVERHGVAARLTVEATFPLAEIHMGASIAVNGVCLTVVGNGGGTFAFDVSPETIDRTAFRRLKSGSRVNLERALRLGQEKDDVDWLHSSAVKSQMRRMDPSFSEKALGYRSFSDFVKSRAAVAELDETSPVRLIRLNPALTPQ